MNLFIIRFLLYSSNYINYFWLIYLPIYIVILFRNFIIGFDDMYIIETLWNESYNQILFPCYSYLQMWHDIRCFILTNISQLPCHGNYDSKKKSIYDNMFEGGVLLRIDDGDGKYDVELINQCLNVSNCNAGLRIVFPHTHYAYTLYASPQSFLVCFSANIRI